MNRWFLVVLVALVVAGCGGQATPTTSIASAQTTPPSTAATATSAADGTTVPTTTTVPLATTLPPVSSPPSHSIDDLQLGLEVIASGFDQPVFVTAVPGDDRLWVVDQPGRIWLIAGDDPQEFLDIRDRVRFRGEQGLLGMALAPDFAQTGAFFVHYSDTSGDTVVSEFQSSGGVADSASERIVLQVDQPASNHNGGMIAFGPDGLLWIGLGDGGGSNDQYAQGQRPDTLLAAMLRIDVSVSPYLVPVDNPFVDGGGAPEVWAYGLRNPWRFAFDGTQLYVADVGQNDFEEVSILDVTTDRGANLGWPLTEGLSCFAVDDCDVSSTFAVYDYDHGDGCSITGGYVYRGAAIPELDGHYFFSDFCTSFLRSLFVDPTGLVSPYDWTGDLPDLRNVFSFGLDGDGEILVVAGRIQNEQSAVGRIVRG